MSRWKHETGWALPEPVLWTVILVLGFQIACGDSPTAPTPTQGVTIYQHPNFGGDEWNFTTSFNNFDALVGPCPNQDPRFLSPSAPPRSTWYRCVSSVKVAEGWSATAFERDDYAGQELTITSDIIDLDDEPGPCGGDWDDCISSIRVFPPG